MTIARDDGGSPELAALRDLAERAGVGLTYRDQLGTERTASSEALVAVLAALGYDLDSPDRAPEALQAIEARGPEATTTACLVTWDGAGATSILVPERDAHAPLMTAVRDDESAGVQLVGAAPVPEQHGLVRLTLRTDGAAPTGVHRLTLTIGETHIAFTVLAAPMRCPRAPARASSVGIFAPLHALRSETMLGTPDVADLDRLGAWCADVGAGFLGTLPLLAVGDDPSPYAPTSRLYWNELYADLRAAPELTDAPAARKLLAARSILDEADALRTAKLVDYRRAGAMRRPVFESLAEAAFAHPTRREKLEGYLRDHPDLVHYARFRAVSERLGSPWPAWPEPLRSGPIEPHPDDERAWRTHVYAQWLTDTQMAALGARLRERGVALYLDLPIGSSATGYDTWRHRDQFVTGLSVGAPPDRLFAGGQDWGLPPLHPVAQRDAGYPYLRAVMRRSMEHAGILRVDHVMGLHRLFCIPHGMTATDGLYVHYPAEELYALLCIEAHRHGTTIVGENLGTVPPETDHMMSTHGLLGMAVAQFEYREDEREALPEPDADVLACLNTHDLPTFRGYWEGRDLDVLAQAGLMDDEQRAAATTMRDRQRTALVRFLREQGRLPAEIPDDGLTEALLRAVLKLLSESDADLLCVNLEDFWLEPDQQNVPGVVHEWPNWRRRAQRTLEEIEGDKALASWLRAIASARVG